MFGSFKEKLKGWLKKNEEVEVETPIKEEKTKKKENKKSPTKNQKKTDSKIKKEAIKSEEETVKELPKKEYKSMFDSVSEKEEDVSKKIPIEEFTQGKEEPEKENIEEAPEKNEEKKSIFSVFQKTVDKEKFEELFEELEIILLQNNCALETVESIKRSLEKELIGKKLKEVNLEEKLKESIEKILINPPNFLDEIKNSLKEKTPFVILFAGINGAGKTTTIAKVTHYLRKNNLSVCIAASDTFRAASIEQIKEHATKLNVPLISKDYGSDPASVGFDAINFAKKNKIDVVLIDTAGRLQNKDSLMREIEKISRVNKPDMKIFLGESITGNDVTEQAKVFHESIGLSGIILSKADVDEKGGTAISVSHVTGKPIYFLGTGQSYNDLEIFNKNKILEKLGF